jgi:hypothetical protein
MGHPKTLFGGLTPKKMTGSLKSNFLIKILPLIAWKKHALLNLFSTESRVPNLTLHSLQSSRTKYL